MPHSAMVAFATTKFVGNHFAVLVLLEDLGLHLCPVNERRADLSFCAATNQKNLSKLYVGTDFSVQFFDVNFGT